MLTTRTCLDAMELMKLSALHLFPGGRAVDSTVGLGRGAFSNGRSFVVQKYRNLCCVGERDMRTPVKIVVSLGRTRRNIHVGRIYPRQSVL